MFYQSTWFWKTLWPVVLVRRKNTVTCIAINCQIHGDYKGVLYLFFIFLFFQDNTEGINCEKCKMSYYRPRNKAREHKDACQCMFTYSCNNNNNFFISATCGVGNKTWYAVQYWPVYLRILYKEFTETCLQYSANQCTVHTKKIVNNICIKLSGRWVHRMSRGLHCSTVINQPLNSKTLPWLSNPHNPAMGPSGHPSHCE